MSSIERSSLFASPVATGSNITQNVNITQQTRQDGQTPVEYSPRPTPQEIFAQLGKVPVFQKADAARAYVGIKVCWRGTFNTMHEVRRYDVTDEGATHFVLFFADGSLLVKVPVDIERLPRLRVTHTGTPMEARGTIAEVGPAIELKDATLSFIDAD